jgi:uncharacterized membrane protein HdeD (DUF308 family)
MTGEQGLGGGRIGQWLVRHWGFVLAQGLYALVFGIVVLVWPDITLGVLIVLFGIYAIAYGVTALVGAIVGRREGIGRVGLVLNGVVAVALGVVVLAWPDLTALALLYLIGAYALAVGLLEIAAAMEFRDVLRHEWLLVLSGLVSTLFGLLIVIRPGDGAVVLAVVISAYAIVYGALLVALALRLRGLAHAGALQEGRRL